MDDEQVRKYLIRGEQEKLFSRQKSYMLTFSDAEHAKRVLEDLKIFCRDGVSTFHQDARKHAVAEGRREVFLRIRDHLELSSQKLWEIYGEGQGVKI